MYLFLKVVGILQLWDIGEVAQELWAPHGRARVQLKSKTWLAGCCAVVLIRVGQYAAKMGKVLSLTICS